MSYRVIICVPTTVSVDIDADSAQEAYDIIKCRLEDAEVEFDDLYSDFGTAYPQAVHALQNGIVLSPTNLLLKERFRP